MASCFSVVRRRPRALLPVGNFSNGVWANRLAAADSLTKYLPKSLQENALRNGENLRVEVEEILGEDGVLLFPSHPTTALRHNVPLLKTNNFIYTAIVNALHLPATQVPLGLDSSGLPLGIQIVAGRNKDHLTLAVAEGWDHGPKVVCSPC